MPTLGFLPQLSKNINKTYCNETLFRLHKSIMPRSFKKMCRDSCMLNAWLQRACLMFESMFLFYRVRFP